RPVKRCIVCPPMLDNYSPGKDNSSEVVSFDPFVTEPPAFSPPPRDAFCPVASQTPGSDDSFATRDSVHPSLPSSPTDVPVVPGYEILGELGRGGMGIVCKARQTRLNRIVALKMILSRGHASAANLARFGTEAEAIARLHHPNFVQIYE